MVETHGNRQIQAIPTEWSYVCIRPISNVYNFMLNREPHTCQPCPHDRKHVEYNFYFWMVSLHAVDSRHTHTHTHSNKLQ